MPTVPNSKKLNASSADILNAIRNSSSDNYRELVPLVSNDNDSIKAIGSIIVGNPTLMNEFISSLVNRIGKVIINDKMYNNPWSMFKKGVLEYGESIEEIFVSMAKPFEYDPAIAEKEVFKREKPDVESVFHILNYQKFYKVTVQEADLRQAFINIGGVTNLITKIIDSLYTAAKYDEFITMKYLIARHILNGDMYPVTVPTVSAQNAKDIISIIKGVSNDFEFMNDSYNMAGVMNVSEKSDQYLIMNSRFDATFDVEVLASAFNMDRAQFMGHKILVDGFGKFDVERLNTLFADDPNFVEITADEMTALNNIPAIIVDRDWFMIYDNLNNFTEQYNGQGMYWNYWYHQWKTFSVSTFANGAVFVPGTPTVTSVTVSPTSATVKPGGQVVLSAVVETENFASQAVKWSISDSEKAEITFGGILHVDRNATTGDNITVTATSVYDPTKTATATVTIS